jgi:WD40 repeat protein
MHRSFQKASSNSITRLLVGTLEKIRLARGSSLTMVLGGAILLSGCGTAPAPKAPVAQQKEDPSSATSSEAGESNATASSPDETGAAGTKPAAAANESPKNTASPPVTAAPSKPATPPKQSPKPTEAQLTKWERTPFEPLELLDCREPKSLNYIALAADARDGRHFVVAGKKVILLSIDPQEPEHVFYECDGEQTIKSLAASPDGKWVAAGDSEGVLRIWSLADKKEIASKKIGTNDVAEFAISPDSQEIAATSYDGVVTVWSANSLEKRKEFKVNSSGLEQLAYMAPGVLVAAAEKMSTYDTATGEIGQTLTTGRYNFTLSPTPDSNLFAFVDEDKLHLWNVAENKREMSFLGAVASKEHLSFSADGKWIVTAGGHSIRIWDRASKQCVQYIDAIGHAISGLCWLPQSNLLVVTSETGRFRVWGTPKAGEAVGLKPMHGPVAAVAKDSKEPITPIQFLQTIDLRSFPTLPDCQGRFNYAYMVDYSANVAPEEAQTFYRYYLSKAGWQESAEKSQVPSTIEFRKNGLLLQASFQSMEASKTTISINVSDNYDLRNVPKYGGAPVSTIHESLQTVMYSTKADLVSIETEMLRKLHAAGWTAYARLNASSSEEPDARSMDFIQNGVQLIVSIGKFPVAPDSYTIQTSTSLSLNGIPIPEDSGFVEFDGSTRPLLVANTKMNLAETQAFYEKELVAQGWLPRESRRSEKEDMAWLNYIRGQCDLTVGLVKLDSGRTLVRIGDGLENSSWQLAEKKSAAEAEQAPVGIEAADFPILNDSKTAKFDPIGKSIEIEMAGESLVEAADKYLKAMTDLGWEQDGAGIKDEEYALIRLKKEKAEISIRGRKNAGKVVMNVQGDELLWTKELPGGKQIMAYETWLRTNKHPTGLELLPKYEQEMRAILAAPKK